MSGLSFYQGKSVFITGHTGFKGAWLSYILAKAGATVVGYALDAPTSPNLFELARINDVVDSIIGDIRDYSALEAAIKRSKPDIVFHLAAQSLVLDGYRNPRYTYETNVMGTVNLLEAIRSSEGVRSVVNVTTDKVYLNKELKAYGYKEDDCLDGYDPYSNSKSCSELLTHSYDVSFLQSLGIAVSTARAGNVIGGGDFSPNRIIPDCVRSVESGEQLILRNPYSIRPYQHVLEPLFAYLMIAEWQWDDSAFASSYNIGPDDSDCVTTETLVGLFAKSWGEGFSWVCSADEAAPHETNFLRLDSSKLKQVFCWQPVWTIADSISLTVDWTREYLARRDICLCMDSQINAYREGI